MTFEECTALAEAGKVCQMMAPDGRWVKFDPKRVITNFRVAPELDRNDGAKVLVYALHALEQKVLDFFSHSGRWVDLPKRGHKENPFLTSGHCGYICGESVRSPVDVVAGKVVFDRYIDPATVRLKDIFRTYFRISKHFTDDTMQPHEVKGVPMYRVMMRSISGEDKWEGLFEVQYMKFKPGDQYNTISSSDEKKYERDWCVRSICLFPLPEEKNIEKSRPEFEARKYTNKFYVNSYSWRTEPVIRQRIPTLSKITPSGDDIFHNLARYLINYLTALSDIDMHFDNFTKFIDRNMEKTNEPTHIVCTPDWKENTSGKSIVCYRQYNEFKDYRDAVLGKLTYGESSLDHYQARAILLRYFNNKYHGTIDEVRCNDKF